MILMGNGNDCSGRVYGKKNRKPGRKRRKSKRERAYGKKGGDYT